MAKFTFGFLGCGNMGGALARAAAQALPGDRIAICDRHPEKTMDLTGCGKAVLADAVTVAAESEYIFLGVKPQVMDVLFTQIRATLQSRQDRFVLVSMAAAISMERIEAFAGLSCPIIRIMPNTPTSVGEGMILYAVNGAVTDGDLAGFLAGMAKAGVADRIPEKMIDGAGCVSGCGPAFVCLFAEALADAGVECGVPRAKAQLYAAQTLLGTAKLLLESGQHPGQLKDAVCSPGGTTIAGVHALERNGFRAAVMDAVTAAKEKTDKMKK